jgi:glyoxylase-like metal-dependent hydrolase (beta-lactamase superfamily II)
LAEIKAWSRAPIYAHAAEQIHLAGRYPYRGSARVCGWLESVGRSLINYQIEKIDRHVADGDFLPFWGGLRVIHLPGHTAGHCGFLSETDNVLFSGDLFASYSFSTHRAPDFLSTEPERIESSLDRVRALNLSGIIPNHYDRLNAPLHLERLQNLS